MDRTFLLTSLITVIIKMTLIAAVSGSVHNSLVVKESRGLKPSVQKIASLIGFGCMGLDPGEANITCKHAKLEKRWGTGMDCTMKVPIRTQAFFLNCPPEMGLVEEYSVITCKFPGNWDNDVFTCDYTSTAAAQTTAKVNATTKTTKKPALSTTKPVNNRTTLPLCSNTIRVNCTRTTLPATTATRTNASVTTYNANTTTAHSGTTASIAGGTTAAAGGTTAAAGGTTAAAGGTTAAAGGTIAAAGGTTAAAGGTTTATTTTAAAATTATNTLAATSVASTTAAVTTTKTTTAAAATTTEGQLTPTTTSAQQTTTLTTTTGPTTTTTATTEHTTTAHTTPGQLTTTTTTAGPSTTTTTTAGPSTTTTTTAGSSTAITTTAGSSTAITTEGILQTTTVTTTQTTIGTTIAATSAPFFDGPPTTMIATSNALPAPVPCLNSTSVYKKFAKNLTNPSWNMAEEKCRSEGGHLACANDFCELRLLLQMAGEIFFIGLNDSKVEGTLDCNDGSIPVVFHPFDSARSPSVAPTWKLDRPNGNTGENCMDFDMGGINDGPCDGNSAKVFICEKTGTTW